MGGLFLLVEIYLILSCFLFLSTLNGVHGTEEEEEEEDVGYYCMSGGWKWHRWRPRRGKTDRVCVLSVRACVREVCGPVGVD
jgi:hypothetical protein